MNAMTATKQHSRMRPGLKLFLLDISVVVCITAALLSASRDMDLLSKTKNGSPSCAQRTQASNAPALEVTPLETSFADKARDSDAFTVGSVVEVRGYPAVVRGVKDDGAGHVTYSLANLIDDDAMPGVDARFLHPYRAYESGAEARCNLQPRPVVKMVPCTVVSHAVSGRFVTYRVVAQLTDDERHIELPMNRVLAKSQPSVARELRASRALPVGSMVEIHGAGFPSIITGVKEDDGGRGNVTYFLANAIYDVPMPGVDGHFVRPYRTYESGTAAYCNVERKPRVTLVPCTVISHMGSGRFMTYKVVAQLKKGDARTIMVSMTRVQRRYLENTHPEGRE